MESVDIGRIGGERQVHATHLRMNAEVTKQPSDARRDHRAAARSRAIRATRGSRALPVPAHRLEQYFSWSSLTFRFVFEQPYYCSPVLDSQCRHIFTGAERHRQLRTLPTTAQLLSTDRARKARGLSRRALLGAARARLRRSARARPRSLVSRQPHTARTARDVCLRATELAVRATS